MRCTIKASRLKGRATAPSSKSYTIRALLAGALADGNSYVSNPLYSDDTWAAIEILRNLGATTTIGESGISIKGGSLHATPATLDCRDSAATLRFISAICATLPGVSALKAGTSLAQRPILPLLEILGKMGASFTCKDNLIVINGGGLRGGIFKIKGDASSQFISALLLIAPLIGEDITYQLDAAPRSRPYIEMTIDTMYKYGVQINTSPDYTVFKTTAQQYRPATFTVEGDWSSASYLLAAGAIAGEVTVEGLNLLSLQGDKIIVSILQKMGAAILPDSSSITTGLSQLHSINFDMSQCIDLLPTVAVCLATAEGTSCLSGISRARLKESDRVHAIREGLFCMGIKTEEAEDKLIIHGGEPKEAIIDSFGDHRIAMAFALLGLKTGGVTITGAECVSKTFPSFWLALKTLGGKIKTDDE